MNASEPEPTACTPPLAATPVSPPRRRPLPLRVAPSPAPDLDDLLDRVGGSPLIDAIGSLAPVAIYIYDLERQQNVYANHTIGETLGYTPAEVAAMGRDVFARLLHPDDLALLPARLARFGSAGDGDMIETEYRMRHAGGGWRWLFSREIIFARDGAGRPTRVLGVAQDVTEWREALDRERRARRQAEVLCQANLALTRSLKLDAVLGAMFGALACLVPYDRAQLILLHAGAVTAAYQAHGPRPLTITPLPIERVDLDGSRLIQAVLAGGAGLLMGAEVGSQLGVPLRANGDLIGVCTVEAPADGVGAEQLQWAEALVAQASVAIQNARLFDEVQIGRRRLQALSHELIRTQETERRTLARELHDEIGQGLVALQLNMRGLIGRQGDTPCGAPLTDSAQLVDQLIQQVRSLSRELRPPLLDELGLVPALSWHIDQLAVRSGLAITLSTHLDDRRLPAEVAISAFRIIQEALTNVVKHARAAHVRVELLQSADELCVAVIDDGVGFDAEAAQQRAASGASLGLISMQERALLANGRSEVCSAPEAGACVRARFPLAPQ